MSTESKTESKSAEIISWDLRGVEVAHSAIVRALEESGLPVEAVRDMLPRNACKRALNKLAASKLTRQTGETTTHIYFQVNDVRLLPESKGAEYPLLTVLALEKATGKVAVHGDVTAAGTEMAEAVEKAIGTESGMRGCGDLTRLIMRLCRKEADLFSPKKGGGVFLAFAHNADFLARLDRFLDRLGNYRLTRFPLADGAMASASTARTVQAGMDEAIEEYEGAVSALLAGDREVAPRKSTLERELETIAVARLKLDGYKEFLRDQYNALVARTDAMTEKLIKAIEGGTSAPADEGEAEGSAPEPGGVEAAVA